MSQRESGYARIPLDAYATPEWVTAALVPHIPQRVLTIWEPACGSGKMVRQLEFNRYIVTGTDIDQGKDFLNGRQPILTDAIITNPPYACAVDFICRSIALMENNGFVAMLLRCDFDHAKGRRDLFGNSSIFAKKVVLTERVRWIEGSTGSPSFNHAWFIWDWRHSGPPVLAYH